VIHLFVLLLGFMLGACAIELKDQVSIHFGTLNFEKTVRCLSMGP
jgi:hypothetical protein